MILTVDIGNTNLERVYSISNVIVNKSLDENASISGVIARAETLEGDDVSNIVDVEEVYYLPEMEDFD